MSERYYGKRLTSREALSMQVGRVSPQMLGRRQRENKQWEWSFSKIEAQIKSIRVYKK